MINFIVYCSVMIGNIPAQQAGRIVVDSYDKCDNHACYKAVRVDFGKRVETVNFNDCLFKPSKELLLINNLKDKNGIAINSN
jgi:hypothetical protein